MEVNNQNNEQSKREYLCIPISDYMDYYQAEGKELSSLIFFTCNVDKEIQSKEEVVALLKQFSSPKKANIRVEGKFFLHHLPTKVNPHELQIITFNCYKILNEYILNVFCKCPPHHPIMVEKQDMSQYDDLQTIFYKELDEEDTILK